jgi:hypothetical protein
MSVTLSSPPLRASGIPFVVWVVLGWLYMAIRWQIDKQRKRKHAANAKTTRQESMPNASSGTQLAGEGTQTPSSRASVPTRRSERSLGGSSAGARTTTAPSSRPSGTDRPAAQRDRSRGSRPSTAPVPGSIRQEIQERGEVDLSSPRRIAETTASEGSEIGDSLRWQEAERLERAGRLGEAHALYAVLQATGTPAVAAAARFRLERLDTIEGRGWAPWDINPFGRTSLLDIFPTSSNAISPGQQQNAVGDTTPADTPAVRKGAA